MRAKPASDRDLELIGTCPAVLDARDRARRVARKDVPVLIHGETGTGKELVARLVHDASPRAKGPFVAINSAAIPRELFESELFGHEPGAFTGARGTRRGAFERASGGTLFLDEIGDLSLEHQAKILRVVQEHELVRVGGVRSVPVDVRLVAASHRNLWALVKKGRFRRDLYFRIACYRVWLPPLRGRGYDVVLVARRIAARLDPPLQLSRDAERLLLDYTWPGNVRELENVLHAAAVDAKGRTITARTIRPHLVHDEGASQIPTHPRPDQSRLANGLAAAHRLGRIDRRAYAAEVGCSGRTATRDLHTLVQRGRLAVKGSGKRRWYEPSEF